jgi:ABC-2 type transport system permease protein
MPIHDQGYRRYGGQKARGGTGWMVITRAGLRTFLAKRTFLGLLLLAWAPFFIDAVRIYLATTVQQANALIAVTADTYRSFLDNGFHHLCVFLIAVYAGAGLIANDRRANALQIYLSKPLSRWEYVCGKLAILMAFLLLVTWVPAIALLIVQVLFAGNFSFFLANLYLFPAITVFSFIEVIMVAASMLALSSLSNSSRYVSILYAALIFFTPALFGVLRFVTGRSAMSLMSFPANLRQVGNAIFRLPLPYDTPWSLSLLMIVGLIAGSGLILERRVRGVEVVV